MMPREVHDVVDCALALAVPEHEAVLRGFSHRAIFHGVAIETPRVARGHNLAGGPVPDVVPAVVLHAVHEDVRMRPVGEVPLNRLVGAVGIPDEDLKPPSRSSCRDGS